MRTKIEDSFLWHLDEMQVAQTVSSSSRISGLDLNEDILVCKYCSQFQEIKTLKPFATAINLCTLNIPEVFLN